MTVRGLVEAICTSDAKGVPKTTVDAAVLREDHGLEGDAHAGPWHRQVSLLASEDVEMMRRAGLPGLKPGDFAENLLVRQVDLAALGLGSRLRLGRDVELTVTQRGKVCHSRCAIHHQVGDCIMPRRGIFARVLTGGRLAVGDAVEVTSIISPEALQVVVLTISDKGARGERVDTAGPAVAGALCDGLPAHLYALEVLPDEQEQIEARLRHYSHGHGIDLVVAVGGTGFSPRDVTPEAIRAVAERLTPGLDEVMRRTSLLKTPRAMLSRAVSGIRDRTLLLSLPGSEAAACENLASILPALPHGLAKLRGEMDDCGAPSSNGARKAGQ